MQRETAGRLPWMPDWSRIDTVLLDMDGTVLDLHFDNHFWTEHLPKRWAESRGMAPAAARDELMAMITRVAGTLDFYCLDYWRARLGLDLVALKREIADGIRMLPHARRFLEALRASGRRSVLVTDCHRDALTLKLERTGLADLVDAVYCSHDHGLPKEDDAFWRALRRAEPFDPARTLLLDDNLRVLDAARRYGIAWTVAVRCPDSRAAPRDTGGRPAVDDLAAIMP
ncbi:MAG TPA: GMP/IMP nucleotidase [Gammaproteobacteria bacterium]|nr:GMP/IMP nucleotidase [Gammaproteobacteria bacterium]